MSSERVAVIGKGGREQALAWKLAQSPLVDEVFVLPGNPGSEYLSQRLNKPITNVELPNTSLDDVLKIVDEYGVSLVVAGSETWLAKGVGNALEEKGVMAVAPTREAAKLETSKVFTREKCRQWGVPQPEFAVFDDVSSATEYIKANNLEEGVIKVDGLADGKGVVVCNSRKEMEEAIFNLREKFPEASKRFIIEEKLRGIEISYIVATDGKSYKTLPPARDYKREYDNNRGDNTGSMGTGVPNEAVNLEVANEIEERILKPILEGMLAEGIEYKGIMYLGIMLTDEGPKLLEINARGGDTETQTQLPVMKGDFYEMCMQTAKGKLSTTPFSGIEINGACVTVVLAGPDYPRSGSKGVEIYGLDDIKDENVIVFQAGTKREGEAIVTNGGRILNITAVDKTLAKAKELAYRQIGVVYFKGMKYRRDIGKANI